MQILAPVKALQRRSRAFLQVALLIVLLGGFIAILGLALFVIELVVPSNTSYETYNAVRTLMLFGGGGIGVLGILLAARAVTLRTTNRAAEIVGQTIAPHYSDQFVFISNLNFRGVGYIDAVLVGPPGVLVFRITEKQGVYFNDVSRWLVQADKGDWRTLKWNPTAETVTDIKKLKEYLTDHDITDVIVYGIIVFMKSPPDAVVNAPEPLVKIAYLSEFADSAFRASYFSQPTIDQSTINRIVKLLYRK